MTTIQLISLGILAIFLFVSMLLYLRLARRFSIHDIPNERSSHSGHVIRGGGIIFLLAVIFWEISFPLASLWFVAGAVLIGVVGFWDDLKNLGWGCRFCIQIVSVLCMLMALGIIRINSAVTPLPWWELALLIFLGVGTLNAYNFMDGINGMIGLSSTVILGSLFYVNYAYFPFIQDELILYPLVASVVFLFFNFRKSALCFSGDVGALVLAYWTLFLILELCIQSGSLVWLGFLIIFGVDTGLTILHRLVLRQKIWEAHRLHLFQVLSNEMKVPHLVVTSIYAVLQLMINLVIIQYWERYAWWLILLCLFVPLALIYSYKFKFLKRHAS